MSDPAQLKALIEAERPHLVVPKVEAIATPMLAVRGRIRVPCKACYPGARRPLLP